VTKDAGQDAGAESPDGVPSHAAYHALIHAEQVKLLYANLPGGLLAGLLNALLLLSVQWDVLAHPVLWGWFGAIAVISMFRYLLVRWYRRGPATTAGAPRQEAWFALGTALSGITWGSAGVFLFPHELANQVFVVFVLAGMTAGAVVSYSSLVRVALYFIVPALLPLTVRLFIVGQHMQFAMGMMSLLFMVLMLATARRMYDTTRNSLGLRFENSDLVAVLAREKAATEDLNRELKREIGERVRIEEGLRESEARIRAVVDNVLDGIITTDAHGVLESLNPAAERIFGYTAADMAGRHFSALMPESERDEYEDYVENYLGARKGKMLGFGLEISGQRSDGSVFPMELGISEMMLNKRRMLIGIVRDITERRKIEHMKNQFISAMSHELRTPLTALIGSLSLLAEGVAGDLSARGKSLLDIARNNTGRLARLVGNILDIDEIQSKNVKLDLQHLNLADLVAQSVEDNRNLAAASGIRLMLESGLTDAPVYGDGVRLTHVVDHLISNAMKFSPHAGVIEIGVEEAGPNIRVSVTDHGPGIPQDLRERIFQTFARTEFFDATSHGGAGIGLSIARALVEAHGGSIGFDTVPGVATRFYFDLPQWHDSGHAQP